MPCYPSRRLPVIMTIGSTIAILLPTGCPSTIARLIVSIGIQPVNCQSLRLFAHVRYEVHERLPTVADHNAPGTVMLEVFVMRVPAPSSHVTPCTIGSRITLSMFDFSHNIYKNRNPKTLGFRLDCVPIAFGLFPGHAPGEEPGRGHRDIPRMHSGRHRGDPGSQRVKPWKPPRAQDGGFRRPGAENARAPPQRSLNGTLEKEETPGVEAGGSMGVVIGMASRTCGASEDRTTRGRPLGDPQLPIPRHYSYTRE
jgi:hypothetical protein